MYLGLAPIVWALVATLPGNIYMHEIPLPDKDYLVSAVLEGGLRAEQ